MRAGTPFLPGHITSNEPAFYAPGKGGFGIRIESVLCVREATSTGAARVLRAATGNERKWYEFERLTCVRISFSSLPFPSLLSSLFLSRRLLPQPL